MHLFSSAKELIQSYREVKSIRFIDEPISFSGKVYYEIL